MPIYEDELSERDLELLSAYLDGELDDSDARMLELRLSQEASLRHALDELRHTVYLASMLPTLQAPRNFTLDPTTYSRTVPWWRRLVAVQNSYQLSGLVGAAAAIALFLSALLLNQWAGSLKPTPHPASYSNTQVALAAPDDASETSAHKETAAPTASPAASESSTLNPTIQTRPSASPEVPPTGSPAPSVEYRPPTGSPSPMDSPGEAAAAFSAESQSVGDQLEADGAIAPEAGIAAPAPAVEEEMGMAGAAPEDVSQPVDSQDSEIPAEIGTETPQGAENLGGFEMPLPTQVSLAPPEANTAFRDEAAGATPGEAVSQPSVDEDTAAARAEASQTLAPGENEIARPEAREAAPIAATGDAPPANISVWLVTIGFVVLLISSGLLALGARKAHRQ